MDSSIAAAAGISASIDGSIQRASICSAATSGRPAPATKNASSVNGSRSVPSGRSQASSSPAACRAASRPARTAGGVSALKSHTCHKGAPGRPSREALRQGGASGTRWPPPSSARRSPSTASSSSARAASRCSAVARSVARAARTARTASSPAISNGLGPARCSSQSANVSANSSPLGQRSCKRPRCQFE